MRHELEEFGYLFIRGFHPDNLIKIARKGKDFSLFFKITKKVLSNQKIRAETEKLFWIFENPTIFFLDFWTFYYV